MYTFVTTKQTPPAFISHDRQFVEFYLLYYTKQTEWITLDNLHHEHFTRLTNYLVFMDKFQFN